MTKGSIGINTVIMIVIGLLALVVVAYLIITTSQGGKDTAFSCETAGGDCLRNCDGMQPYPLGDGSCKDSSTGPKCCV